MKLNGTPKIIAIAGPKGGCGKTTLAAGIARVYASQGFRVLLVDLDQFGQSDAFALNMTPEDVAIDDTPSMPVRAYSNDEEDINDCSAPGRQPLAMRRTPFANLWLTTAAPGDVSSFIDLLRATKSDIVIIDMVSGYRYADVFDAADVGVLVANPEPASIFEATQWIRYVISHRFNDDPLLSPCCHGPSWRFETSYRDVPENLTPRFLNSVISRRICFVLNHRREGSENTQAQALCHAWSVFLGCDVRFAGSLHFEERRWFFTRKFTPDDPLAQEDSIQSELEQIASTLDANDFPARPCLAMAQPLRDARDFLTLEPNEEPRHAYRRLYEGYRRENGLVAWGLPHDFVRRMMNSLDAAWQHLHHEATHASTSIMPAVETPSVSELPPVTRRLSGTFADLRSYQPGSSDLNAGQWLRAARENTHTTISTLAFKTRISPKILEQIENRDVDRIPATYLQAYLFEIAKALDLPLPEVRAKFGFKN